MDSGYVCVEFPRAVVAVSHVIKDKGSGVENALRATSLFQIALEIIWLPIQIVTLSKYGHDALDICHP